MMPKRNNIADKIDFFSKIALGKEISKINQNKLISNEVNKSNLTNSNLKRKEQKLDKILPNKTESELNSSADKNAKVLPNICTKKESFMKNKIDKNNKINTKKWNLYNPLEMLARKREDYLTKISQKIYLIEEILHEKQTKPYVDIKLKNYMIYRFNSRELKEFKNVQYFPEPQINMSFIISVCKSVSCWLEIKDDNIVILEKSEKLYNFLVLIGSLVTFIHPKENVYKILETKCFLKEFYAIRRHLSLFDKILHKKLETNKTQILFYQVIFSTKKENLSFYGKGNFILKVYAENKLYEFYSNKEPNHQDDFYLIFFLNEIEIQGDIKLVLSCHREIICEVNFNAFSYELGIYRIEENAFDFIKRKNIAGIWMDVAFKENKFKKIIMPYNLESNFLEKLHIVNEHFNKNINKSTFTKLYEKYNKTFAKFVLLQEISLVELEKYMKNVSDNIDKKILYKGMNENKMMNAFLENKNAHLEKKEVQIIQPMESKIKELKESLQILEIKPKEEKDFNKIKYFSSNEEYKNETLDLIPELSTEETNNFQMRTIRRPPPPSSSKKKEPEVPSVFARRPLHLTGMMSTSSIFNDLSDLNVKYDTDKFEEWFCDPVSQKKEENTKKEKVSILAEKKAFLCHLAAKNLEKKNYNFMKLDFHLKNEFDKLELDDLVNIQNLLLKENEIIQLENYSSEELDPLERQIIKYSKDVFFRNILSILLFDKKIGDDSVIINRILGIYSYNLNALLENKTVKLILKLTLELSNAVNYKYTLNKKKINNFRMSSLKSLESYKGKGRNQNLFIFLCDSLENKKEEVINELNNFSDIKVIIDVELREIREKINELLKEHKECNDKVKIFTDNKIKNHSNKILGYAYKFLHEAKHKFIEIEKLAKKVQEKFCDSKDENINSVFKDLNAFFNDLKKELQK